MTPTFHLRPVTPTRSDVYADDGVFDGFRFSIWKSLPAVIRGLCCPRKASEKRKGIDEDRCRFL
jgi:hypothetical protein